MNKCWKVHSHLIVAYSFVCDVQIKRGHLKSPRHPLFFLYKIYSFFNSMLSSFNCSGEIGAGELIITSRPELFFGNAI